MYNVWLLVLVLAHVYIAGVTGTGLGGCLLQDDLSEECEDPHAVCVYNSTSQFNECQCLDGYFYSDGRCRTNGTPLPRADYDSDWISSLDCIKPPYCNFLHGFNETPAIAQVQIKTYEYVYEAIGFRPDGSGEYLINPDFVVYIYDDRYINISTTFEYGGERYISKKPNSYMGHNPTSNVYHTKIRARAWRLATLPEPDFKTSGRSLKANTSKPGDSFYEVSHGFDDYPGLVVVRAKMVHNGSIFYANGVGSGLNVFYNDTTKTNAYLVYGFNNQTFRVWVDSSIYGAIFDGRKYTRFDWVVSEAEVEIFAWKLSTLPPYFTRRVSLNTDDYEYSIQFSIRFILENGLTLAFTEIRNETAINDGYRFPTSGYMANIDDWFLGEECTFGGATFGYQQDYGVSLILWNTPSRNKWKMNIPKNNYERTGLLCIPRTFGNGTYAERANGGTLVVYSWIDDCEEPTGEHSTLDASVNGTAVGSYVPKTCDVGYYSSEPLARCSAEYEWTDNHCYIVNCREYPDIANGTALANGTSYGSNVTYACNEGFALQGDAVITCLANGTWSGNFTRCVEVPPTTTTTTTGTTTTSSVDTSTGTTVSARVLEFITLVCVVFIAIAVSM